MLVPHLHFKGCCSKALELYARAFNTKADVIYFSNPNNPAEGISHAEMRIHGQRVMLNDRFGKDRQSTDTAVQMIVIFHEDDQLKETYNILCEGSMTIDPMSETSYSPCAVTFIDKFGVQWGFMVDEA